MTATPPTHPDRAAWLAWVIRQAAAHSAALNAEAQS